MRGKGRSPETSPSPRFFQEDHGVALENKLSNVRQRIAAACGRAGRDAGGVTLVVVTKTIGTGVIRELLDLGVADIGENRVQDAAAKMDELGSCCPASLHMIGHLQRNKVAQAVRIAAMIHSIDSIRLAEAVSKAAVGQGKSVPVLMEVNVTGEESKFGFSPGAAREAAPGIAALPGIDLQGLMTMAPFGAGEPALRCSFRSLRELRDEIAADLATSLPHLSMGMSQDYEIAVEEGATIVRVGTAIVG